MFFFLYLCICIIWDLIPIFFFIYYYYFAIQKKKKKMCLCLKSKLISKFKMFYVCILLLFGLFGIQVQMNFCKKKKKKVSNELFQLLFL